MPDPLRENLNTHTKVALISRQLDDSQGWGLGLARTVVVAVAVVAVKGVVTDSASLTSPLWHRVALPPR